MSKMIFIEEAKVQQALEALETPIHEQPLGLKQKAITALRTAIEQAGKQEPVIPAGIITAIRNAGLTLIKTQQGYVLQRIEGIKAQATPPAAPYRAVKTVHEGKPVYVSEPAAPVQEPGTLNINRLEQWLDASLKEKAAQRQWVGLTPDDIRLLEKENTVGGLHGDYCPTWDLIEAVEAKLREKNGGGA